MTIIKKSLDVEIQKSSEAGYDARFILSAGTPDRVNDTIDEKAYLPNLGKSLIALWQHNHDQPVGKWENLKVQGKQFIGDLKLASTNLGKMIKALLDDDIPLGASIGFSGRGEPNDKGGIHFDEIEIYETSIVSVPCHQRAVRIAKSYGIDLPEVMSEDDNQDLAVSGPQTGIHEDAIKQAKLAVLRANQLLRAKR